MAPSTIPAIDLRPAIGGTAAQRRQVACGIDAIAKQTGAAKMGADPA